MASTAKRDRSWIWWLAGLTLGAALLYWLPPERYRLYPRCLLYAWTGLQCPGCGGLRAAHQLLHGQVAAAFQLNPLVVLGVPLAAAWAAARVVERTTGRDWLRPLRRPGWVWALLASALVFAVARNLPFGPFAASAH